MTTKKILFCTDFSENSLPARDKAVEFARVFGAKLMILHIVNASPLGYPIFEERIPVDMVKLQQDIQAGVKEELEAAAEACGSELAESVEAHFRVGDPATEIVRFAEEEKVDYIVLGTHGWTGIRHLILGSTAENVVRSAKCPVLTVRGESALED
jgi:nucleotide-binding universal stress UspA family protein